MAWSRAPDGAAATAARPDEPRPKTTRSLLDTVTEGDVLEDEAARTSTGWLWSTPAKAIVTAPTPFLGEMRTRTAAGTDRPVKLRQAASRVPAPWLWPRISLAPEAHVTLEPRRVSTKVSRTSPAAVPAGTLVTAVAALEDSKVVAVPTWVMVVVAAVADASRGTARIPAATTMMPAATTMMLIDAPMMPFQQRDRARWPRRVRPLRRRGPVSSALLNRFEPPRDPSRRCADMSVSFGAMRRRLHNRCVTNLARRGPRRAELSDSCLVVLLVADACPGVAHLASLSSRFDSKCNDFIS